MTTRFSLAILVGVAASGCNSSISDEEKIRELAKRCEESSSEFITANSATGPVNLHEAASGIVGRIGSHKNQKGMFYLDTPVGSKAINALDLEYNPEALLKTLFINPDALTEVRYFYYRPNYCYSGRGVIVTSADEAARESKPKRCLPKPPTESKEIEVARYNILQAYGVADEYDIRPFMFWINDRENGRVLAEQISFQLLLGGMSDENIVMHAWGGAQGVRNCRLTPPDQLVKQVFRQGP